MQLLRWQLLSAAAAVALSTFGPSASFAQTRDTQVPAAGGGGAGTIRDIPNVKLPGTTIPGATAPTPDGPGRPGTDGPNADGPVSGGPSSDGQRPDGGGSTAGLPDAVTILNILWGLPRPQFDGPSATSDYGPPDRGPAPKGGTPPAVAPSRPLPVLTATAGTPFVPKPLSRPPTAPPVITGAVLPEVREREVIVTLGPGSNAATATELARDYGLRGDTLYTSALLGTRVVRLTIPDARSIADVLQQISGDARIEVVQPNYVFTASGAAAAPLPVPQYAIDKLRLGEAHKLARGKRVKVAVIDTGVDTAHPAFSGALHDTFNALSASKDSPEAHGTSIAGIVGARAGFAGVAPDAQVLSARAFTSAASGPAQSHTLAVLKSLDWAVSRGARVVNMSFAGPEDPLLGRAIAAAVKQGVVVVAAAGNGGPDAKPAYPAAFADVIAVSATDSGDKLYDKANRGAYIAIAAPGVDIVAPAPKGAYDISSGTSLAAAHVSGIAALMLEKEPKLNAADVRKRLAGAASNPGNASADLVGAGIVDAAKALQAK